MNEEGKTKRRASLLRPQFHQCFKTRAPLLQITPTKELEQKYPNLDLQRRIIHFVVEQDQVDKAPKRTTVEIPILEIRDQLDQCFNDVIEKIANDEELSKFNHGRKELAKKIEPKLPTIRRYIERYYPIEKI